MEETVTPGEMPQIKFVSKRSDDYKLEFINGAISGITPRGEIVCDFHFESKDRPTEQFVEAFTENGSATLSPFKDTGTYTRDVKFGIVINAAFAKDLLEMLNKKIKECESVLDEKAKKGEHK